MATATPSNELSVLSDEEILESIRGFASGDLPARALAKRQEQAAPTAIIVPTSKEESTFQSRFKALPDSELKARIDAVKESMGKTGDTNQSDLFLIRQWARSGSGGAKAAIGTAIGRNDPFQVDPNIPVDTQTGADASTRASLSFRPTMDEKLKFLEGEYGKENVFLRQGQLFIRTPDGEGGQVDLKVDETANTAKELADFSGRIPETAAAIAIAALTKSPTSLFQLGRLSRPSLTAAGVGGVQDTMVRFKDDNDFNIGETFKRRGVEAVIGSIIDGGVLGAVKLGRGIANPIISPFGGKSGEFQKDALRAIDDLNKEFGIKVTPTTAMETGSEAAIRAEVFSESVAPGGPLALKNAKMGEDLKLIQDMLTKTSTKAPTDHEILQGFRDVFIREKGDIIREASNIRSSVALEMQKDFESVMRNLTGTPPMQSLIESAKQIRGKIISKNDQVTKVRNQLYDDAYTAIEQAGGGKIPAEQLAVAVDQALSDLPKTVRGDIIEQFIPGVANRFKKGIEKRAESVEGAFIHKPEPLSFREIKKMSNLLKEGVDFEAISGFNNSIAKRVASVLDKQAKLSISGPKFSAATKKLDKANKFFKDEVLKFRESGIRELFVSMKGGKPVFDEDIILNLMSKSGGPTRIRQLKDILGETSAEYGLVKRAVMDKTLETAVDGRGWINGKAALTLLGNLDKDIQQELFGQKGLQVIRKLKDIASAKGVAMGDIPKDDLLKTTDTFTDTEAGLLFQKLAGAEVLEKRAKKNYANTIIKAVIDDEAGAGIIDPGQFISKFYHDASAKELKQVMSKIPAGSDIHEGVRIKLIEDFLIRSQNLKTAKDFAIGAKGRDVLFDVKKATNQLKKEASKLETVLSPKDIKNIQDLISVEALRVHRDVTGGLAGGLAAGEVTSNPIRNIHKIVQFRLISTALASEGAIGAWAKNTWRIPDLSANAVKTLMGTSQGVKLLQRQMQEDPNLKKFVMDFIMGASQSEEDQQETPSPID
jgi:hypothetical protein